MQLFSRNKALFALSIGALVALGACGDDVTVSDYTPPETVTISPPSANMNVGESLVFAVQISGGNATTPSTLASCSSSNSAVATATVAGSACTVKAVAAGNATVTATTSSGKSAAASVSVAAPAAAISNLTVSPSAVNLPVNQTVTIVPNVTKAAASVATTYTFTSSDNTIASVNTSGVVTAVAPGVATITVKASGSGAGYSTTELTGAATVTVTALPSGITALNVQPASLVMGLGTTAQLSASAQQPNGAAAATITYGTTVPSVAQVDANGLVTAVAPGTATITVTATSAANTNFAAATLTQLVAVTVSPSANVTIKTITQGPIKTTYSTTSDREGLLTDNNAQVNQPVDITNVRDQIQVVLNLQPNGQRVDSVVVFVADANGNNRRAAARQLYSNGTANQGDITLFVNTADFDADFGSGVATVYYPNGQKLISASVFTTQGTDVIEQQNAENNRQTLNFNNLDGYAAKYVSPSRSAIHAVDNLTWWGGPGDQGAGSYSIVPVFYTPNRSVTRIDVQIREGLPSAASANFCNNTRRYTAVPFSGEYSSGVNTTINTVDTFIDCSDNEVVARGDAPNFVGVVAGTDNYNNPAPMVNRVDGYRFSAQVSAIVANRLDYEGPSTTEPDIRRTAPTSSSANTWVQPAVTGWVNAAFNFQSQTEASEDDGIGMPTTSSRAWYYNGCGASKAAMPTQSGADIPECTTDNQGGWNPIASASGDYGLKTRGPYTAAYTENDVLLNQSTSPSSRKFGVDKTAPLIRLSQATDADTAWGTSSRSIQAEVIDERAGFIDGNDNSAILRNSNTSDFILNPGTINFTSFQHFATRGASSVNPAVLDAASANNVNCINPNSLTSISLGGGSTPITNPVCTFINQKTFLGGMLLDGYRPAVAVTFSRDGIYSYRSRIFDRAGNVSQVIGRSYAVESGAPTFSDLNVPSSISTSANPNFGVVTSANAELRAYHLDLKYLNVGRFFYSQTLLSPRFDDVINTPYNGNFTVPTPAPFVTALEVLASTTVPSYSSSPVSIPNVVVVNAGFYNTSKQATALPAPVGFGAVTLAALKSISGVNGSSSADDYGTWRVMDAVGEMDPGFNAPQGLKAQLTGNTNVPNPPFVRTDFYRFGTVGGDTTYQYIGSATAATQTDIGTTRFWTWTLTPDLYAKTRTALESTERQAQIGDVIIAVGVRSNGAGLMSMQGTIGGSALAVTVSGLPSGASPNVTFTNGLGFTMTVTAAGTYPLPASVVGTTVTASVGNVTHNFMQYVGTAAPASFTATAGVNTVAVTYTLATTNIPVNVTFAGGVPGPFPVAINGVAPVSYSFSGTQAGNTTSTYTVPQAGSYNVTGTAGTYGTSAGAVNGFAYTVVNPATSTVVAGSATATAVVAYTNTTNYIRLTVSGAPSGASVSTVCAGDAAVATTTNVTNKTITASGANVCTTTATTVAVEDPSTHIVTVYVPTISGTATASVLGTNSTTVTYAASNSNITVNAQSIGTGANNLPNGIPYTVRLTSSVYASLGGYKDFAAVTGTPLVISTPVGIYNVSTSLSMVSGTQTWNIVSPSTSAGVTYTGSRSTDAAARNPNAINAVVQNIKIHSASAPDLAAAVGDIQAVVNFIYTGPIGSP